MDSENDIKERLRVDTPLRMIFYAEEGAVAVSAKIKSLQPLVATTPDNHALMAKKGVRAMLIMTDRGQYLKAESEVVNVERNGEIEISLADQLWEVVDRRRYPRYEVKLPVHFRAIREIEGEAVVRDYNGSTQDISIGGAWVELEETIEQGSLIEFQATLNPYDQIRVLAIVAYADPEGKGYGVEFLDYIGSARYTLHNFLIQAA